MGALGQGEGKSDENKYKRKNIKERGGKGKREGRLGKGEEIEGKGGKLQSIGRMVN